MNKVKTSNIFLQLSVITAIIFFIWHKTLDQTLWGDGFYWFNPGLRGAVKLFPIDLSKTVYNTLSRNIFDFIIPVIRDNIAAYQLLQIVLLTILTATIYLVALKLTKKTLIAFTSCVLFVSNYGGMYEMMAEGNLNRFLERVPNLIFVVIAIYFLINFLETKKIKHLIISWILYFAGIYFGHFASFVLPFFVFFPIIYLFDIKRPARSLAFGISIALLFCFTNFEIIKNADQRSGYELSYYLDPSQRFVEKIFLMTTPLIVPRELVINLAHILHIPNPYVSLVQFYSVVLIIFSIVVGKYFYSNNKQFFKIYLASVLTILSGTALMIYTDPIKYDPFLNFGAGRHLFIQSIFYSIVLASFLVNFFQNRKKYFPGIVFLLVTIFAVYNTNLSWRDVDATQYVYEGNKKYFSFIRSLFPKFNSETVVVVGPRIYAPSLFINEFYGPPKVSFVSAPEDIAVALKTADKNNIFVLDINYNPTKEGYYLSDRVYIADLTEVYRKNDLDLVSTWGTQPVTWFEALNTQK